ncbi:S-adenosyl-L-methionine-dependent methyltransferase [Cubamyces sp. BRFM 1775]|nr:S-adenosyl-L-methionine-dependent methyltransferase [Cubamyces sp. BRFM 1775]
MTFQAIRALHACIGSAIDELERIFHQSGPTSLDFPPLNDPVSPPDAPPCSEALAEELANGPAALVPIRYIVAACAQLSATVNRPFDGLIDAIQGGQLSACVRFMEAAHVVEILRGAGSEGMHVDDICQAIVDLRPKSSVTCQDTKNLTPERLVHVLRVLATTHWLREVSPNVFANNRRSSVVDTGKTLEDLRNDPANKFTGTNGIAASVSHISDELSKSGMHLTEWLLPDVRYINPSSHYGASPEPPQHSRDDQQGIRHFAPFNLAYRTKLGYFDWLELPGHAHKLKRVEHSMTGTAGWEVKGEVLRAFPWDQLAEGSLLVDVGGGIGSASIQVAQVHPNIRVVVEDRVPVMDTAHSAWGSNHKELFQSGRVSWRYRDFFAPWKPFVDGKVPDVFLLRLVLHDWPDEDARRRLRPAAGPNTKLIIGDMLLMHACHNNGESALVKQDSPLLANLGAANLQPYLLDLMMTAMLAGKERTMAEMAELLLSAGWKMSQVRRSAASLWAYTIAVPV